MSLINVEGLSKRYLVGHQSASRERYTALRDVISRHAGNFFRKTRDMLAGRQIIQGDVIEEFWALKNVSFELQQGEVIGIIGRNGAGKSTLLKVLSRITEPTQGRVRIKGRVASLLEVGTGFHPELTGRENIFLNGAILGMTRSEIKRKFDEIVAFADVERFLDTPVKRYSSGMYVRLAFAVAAHLEPEILIVDEVLAVGDAAFQKKCLGQMGNVARAGRTVIFVSHNMAAVTSLCSKAMVLQQGSVVYPLGEVNSAVQRYLSSVSESNRSEISNRKDREGEGRIRIVDFQVCDSNGTLHDVVVSGQDIELRVYYSCLDNPSPRNVVAAITISSVTGGFVTMLTNQSASEPFDRIDEEGYFACRLEKLPLGPGGYTLNLAIAQSDVLQDWVPDAATLVVEEGDFFGTGRLPPPGRRGVFFQQLWSLARPLEV